MLSAGRPASPASAAALSTLCQRYWYPLYVYVRRTIRNIDVERIKFQPIGATPYPIGRKNCRSRPHKGIEDNVATP